MFRTEDVRARRIARTWSGVVLLLGALLLYVYGARAADGQLPTAIIVGTWATAFVTYHGLAVRRSRAPASHLARASVIVPSLGVLALLPLTLHLPFFALAGAVDSFPGWIGLAAIFTAPTTIVAGVLMAIRGSELATCGAVSSRVLQPWAIYGIAILASGPILLLVVPGILIAVTGLPLITLMRYQETLVERERAIAELGEIPVALARFRALA